MRRQIIALALPNIVSNITVPLLSLVDVGLAGNMDSYGSIGSVALASVSVSTLYWLFGFLRLGTTGLVAQSYGAEDIRGINRHLGRGIFLAMLFGFILTFLTPLMVQFATFMAQGDAALAIQAKEYIRIALLGAPAAMLLYVLNGWFIGMQDTRTPMTAAIFINLLNIGLSYAFVRGTSMGVEGLALGTIIAQYIGVIFLFSAAWYRYRRYLCQFILSEIVNFEGLNRYLGLNRDLFLRSALLSSVTVFFTYASTTEGEVIVSANTLLLQLFTLFSYFMDGFAYAGEALMGRFVGMQRRDLAHRLVGELFLIAAPLSLLTAILYFLFPHPILNLLSNRADIVGAALQYIVWIALVPPLGFAAFLWDGVFVGATYARGLFGSMLVAAVFFFGLYYALHPYLGATALWVAFDSYLLTRGLIQTLLYPRLLGRIKSVPSITKT